MREILFRGKLDIGEWAYGNLEVKTAKVCIITPDDTPLGKYGQVIPETVGQYTGLTDKNGKKIFEGDILKGVWGTLIKVYFDESYLQFRAKEFTHRTVENSIDYYGDNSRLEVVGNIYDTPELLKARQ